MKITVRKVEPVKPRLVIRIKAQAHIHMPEDRPFTDNHGQVRSASWCRVCGRCLRVNPLRPPVFARPPVRVAIRKPLRCHQCRVRGLDVSREMIPDNCLIANIAGRLTPIDPMGTVWKPRKLCWTCWVAPLAPTRRRVVKVGFITKPKIVLRRVPRG